MKTQVGIGTLEKRSPGNEGNAPGLGGIASTVPGRTDHRLA